MELLTKIFSQMNFNLISPLTKVAGLTIIFVFIFRYVTIKFESFNNSKFRDLIIGIVFGLITVYANEGGASNLDGVILNIRNVGPLVSGLVFSGPSGIIAGLIGGVYRWFAVYWGSGYFTRIGCSVACITAGFMACYVKIILNENRKVNFLFAFLIGVISEVFHLLLIFLTNVNDAIKAFEVDSIVGPYMITGVALTVSFSVLLDNLITGGEFELFETNPEKRKLSDNFQMRLFIIIIIASFLSINFINATQFNTHRAQVSQRLNTSINNLSSIMDKETGDIDEMCIIADSMRVGQSGEIFLYSKNGRLLNKKGLYSEESNVSPDALDFKHTRRNVGFNKEIIDTYQQGEVFTIDVNAKPSYCIYMDRGDYILLASYPTSEADLSTDVTMMILIFTQIIIYAALFAFIFYEIHSLIVKNMQKINTSLSKITKGDLDLKVNVGSSIEFNELSKDINTMIAALKNYANEEKLRIEKELDLAKKIQTQSLPNVFPAYPTVQSFDIYATMTTAKEVGGDFYDFYFTDLNKFYFLIADVSGKGVAAAMFMMQAKSFIKSYAEKSYNIEYVANEVNKKLSENNDSNMFVTAFICCIDLKNGIIEYINAGHNPPIIKREDGACGYLTVKRNFVFAGTSDYQFKKDTVTLNPGDTILLYTDGLTEAINPKVEQYGEERLLDSVKNDDTNDMNKFVNHILDEQDKFVNGANQFDDITILAFKFKGSQNMKELNIEAKVENIEKVIDFVNAELDAVNCTPKIKSQIDIAIDELFSNIANYAYDPSVGPATVRVEVTKDPLSVIITFIDHGVPYDPLKKADPNTSLSAEERVEGGLGIFLVKKSMDSIDYEYKDGQNILKIKKNL